jgi:hypothetical protein
VKEAAIAWPVLRCPGVYLTLDGVRAVIPEIRFTR